MIVDPPEAYNDGGKGHNDESYWRVPEEETFEFTATTLVDGDVHTLNIGEDHDEAEYEGGNLHFETVEVVVEAHECSAHLLHNEQMQPIIGHFLV